MKYIRLKDEICEIDAEDSECYYFKNLKKFVYKDEDYKVDDTIEELCDEFVLENEIKANSPYSLIDKKTFNEMKKTIAETIKITNQSFYGAIWTDKGLIYVAKMNDKGELELI